MQPKADLAGHCARTSQWRRKSVPSRNRWIGGNSVLCCYHVTVTLTSQKATQCRFCETVAIGWCRIEVHNTQVSGNGK
jgi:hypothetical protein